MPGDTSPGQDWGQLFGTQLGPLFKRKDPLIRFASPLDDVIETSPESVNADIKASPELVDAGIRLINASVEASPELINAGIRLIDANR